MKITIEVEESVQPRQIEKYVPTLHGVGQVTKVYVGRSELHVTFESGETHVLPIRPDAIIRSGEDP